MDEAAKAYLMERVRISDAGCWEWQRATNRGYGIMQYKKARYRAHRFAYECFAGPIPEGLAVCHRCDNPACCNPEHLFLGTQADNISDAATKGRNGMQRHPHRSHFNVYRHPVKRGDNHHKVTIPDAELSEIFRLHAEGKTGYEIAAAYGVHNSTIYRILRGDVRKWT